MRRKAEQIVWLSETFLGWGVKIVAVTSGSLREREGVSCLSLNKSAFHQSEIRLDATNDTSAELWKEHHCVSGQNTSLDLYYLFTDCTLCSNDVDRVKSKIWQLARLDAWIATVVICLGEHERQGSRRQKIYADSWASYANSVVRQLLERAGSFIMAWEADKQYKTPFQYNSDCIVQRNWAFLKQENWTS